MSLPALFIREDVSPELMYVKCPDCGTICQIRYTLLMAVDKIVNITACRTCDDKKTIRFSKDVDHDVFIAASVQGLPIISFKRRAA